MKVNILHRPGFSGHRSTLFVCFFLFLFQGIAFSQVGTVSGKVLLGNGAADLSGTTVQVKGSRKAVTTDATGHFSVTAPGTASLVFSHIGFKTVEIRVNGQSEIN